jgi:hypothetical protein
MLMLILNRKICLSLVKLSTMNFMANKQFKTLQLCLRTVTSNILIISKKIMISLFLIHTFKKSFSKKC